MKIQSDILNAFNLNGEIKPLNGGQNTSVRVKDAVLKPVDSNVNFCEWALNVFNQINPSGYRIAKPIKSNRNTFVYNGYCCTHFEPGKHRDGNLKEKLEVSRRFHHDLKKINFINIPQTNDPWSISHQIAWQKGKLPLSISIESCKIIHKLLSKLSLQGNYHKQIIHADLSGNILFDDSLTPLIIDFSPMIAPVEYADAILVCDSIAWQGSPLTEIEFISHSKCGEEMILRAIIFRLSVAAIFAGNNTEEFYKEYKNFKPIINYLNIH